MGRRGALLMVVALGCLLISPISSRATSATLNVDCSAFVNSGNYYVIPGSTVSVTTSGCTTIIKNGVDTLATSLVISASEVNTSTPLRLKFETSGDERHSTYFYLAGNDDTSLAPVALERTVTMTIPVSSPNYFTNTSSPIGGISGCGMAIGSHPYVTHNLTITASGNFTFRITNTIPNTDANSAAAVAPSAFNPFDYPIADPFLAVYQNFDPLNPNSNIVGCNDDLSGTRYNYLSDGTVINEYWSKFQANLNPGDYTLVLTTYGTFTGLSGGTGTWLTKTNNVDQTALMQLWGPSGSIIPIVSPSPTPVDDDGSWKIKSAEAIDCVSKSFVINFAGGSSNLDKNAKNKLKNISSEIKRCGYVDIKIDGYTSIDKKDSLKYKIFRKNLSFARASKVESEIKSNLNKNQLKLKYKKRALSEKNPIKSNRTEKTRPANRRVEITLSK